MFLGGQDQIDREGTESGGSDQHSDSTSPRDNEAASNTDTDNEGSAEEVMIGVN